MSHDLRGLAVAHYKLVEPIDDDGRVWRAREDRLERDVAIKIVFPGNSEEDARRELRLLIEAKATARIQSRYVARVLMLGTTDDGAPFVATELLQGETLAALLKRETLSVERATRIASHIARGLAAAHSAGVLHRGLDPSRIMIVDDDCEREIAKIIDFGVAKRINSCDAELTRRGEILAAEEYSAPEIGQGADDIDPRVDIYAFGMIAKKMFGAKAPPQIQQ